MCHQLRVAMARLPTHFVPIQKTSSILTPEVLAVTCNICT